MKTPKKDKLNPTRDLTPNEMSFLNALASYTIYFDKSLFFQIDDLQQHTELVLSGKNIYREELPKSVSEIKKEIEELEIYIRELEEKLRKGESSQEDWSVLELLKKQLEELKDALDELEAFGDDDIPEILFVGGSLLGKYCHNNGKNSKVILYVDTIDRYAKGDPHDAMFLMGQVFLHEYFHSFYYHVGLGKQHAFSCAEEPMAEYGSMVFLDRIASSKEFIAPVAKGALTYSINFIKRKQKSVGKTAAYGFGAFLFDIHKDDYRSLIARFANVSRLLDKHSKEAIEYKYMLYPYYPKSSWLEKMTYEKFDKLLNSGTSTPSFLKVAKTMPTTVGSKGTLVVGDSNRERFAKQVFQHLEKVGLLVNLFPYITKKSNPQLRSLSYKKDRTFVFNLSGIFREDLSTLAHTKHHGIKDWDDSHVYKITPTEKYYLTKEWYKSGKNRCSIEELRNMIDCLFPNYSIVDTGGVFELWK